MEEVARVTAEKPAAEQLASDLQDDFDVGVEEARHAAAVECRDATATENVSRGVTFDFFDSLFPPLDGADPVATISPSGIFSLLFFSRKCLAHAF